MERTSLIRRHLCSDFLYLKSTTLPPVFLEYGKGMSACSVHPRNFFTTPSVTVHWRKLFFEYIPATQRFNYRKCLYHRRFTSNGR